MVGDIFNLLHQWPFGVWSRRGHAEILSFAPSMAFPPRALLCTPTLVVLVHYVDYIYNLVGDHSYITYVSTCRGEGRSENAHFCLFSVLKHAYVGGREVQKT